MRTAIDFNSIDKIFRELKNYLMDLFYEAISLDYDDVIIYDGNYGDIDIMIDWSKTIKSFEDNKSLVYFDVIIPEHYDPDGEYQIDKLTQSWVLDWEDIINTDQFISILHQLKIDKHMEEVFLNYKHISDLRKKEEKLKGELDNFTVNYNSQLQRCHELIKYYLSKCPK